MALKNPSLFLYGFEVTANNSSLDFRAVVAETPRQATLNPGFYSLTSLMLEIIRALQAADPDNTYLVTADRSVAGGTQNRVTIQTTTGTFLQLLFATGPRASSSCRTLIGFTATDFSGFLTYTGSSSAGTPLIPNFTGYNYLAPTFYQKNFGMVNVSASGLKEAIVFNVQKFWQVQFKYIPEATWIAQWTPLMNWMIQQKRLEFTPDISDANTFFEGTLETTTADGKGLSFKAVEQLPEFPFHYDTGIMSFRQTLVTQTFIGG